MSIHTSHKAIFISSLGKQVIDWNKDITDTVELDGVRYEYVGTQDGVAFYRAIEILNTTHLQSSILTRLSQGML